MTDSVQRRVRFLVLEALYESEASEHDAMEAFERRVRDVAEEDPRVADAKMERFGARMVDGVLEMKGELDEHIGAAATRYPVETLAVVDRNILRLAVWELLSDNSASVAAVVNEAVELAHRYGGESSPAFVNGVLGTISKRIRATIGEESPDGGQSGSTTQE